MNFDFINELGAEELKELQNRVEARIKECRKEDRKLYAERLKTLLLEMSKNEYCIYTDGASYLEPDGDWDIEDLLK